jgi:hypothetical protein
MSPNGAIERILEVSAEAQIKRREAADDSPAFHNLTGAIIAYGKALGLLSKLKEVRALCVVGIALLFIIFNGGIDVGFSNHTNLLPVVRRILNPDYLPGDFGITLRFYHHRVFAYLIAGCATLWGEDRALIILNVAGMLCLSAALYYLCRVLRISLLGFLVGGIFIALNVGWAGLGLELNNFVGNREIQPPTFAHAFMLTAVASLLKRRYRLTAWLAGLVTLSHVQIGIIFVIVLIPFYVAKIKQFRAKQILYMALLFLIPASFSLWHLFRMMQQGLMGSAFSLYYINFRLPHHFELMSIAAAAWVTANVLLQAGVYEWLRRTGRSEFRMIGILLLISLMLAILAVAHLVDYYWLKNVTLLELQFLRLSPFITVFGVLSLLVALQFWAEVGARCKGRASLAVLSLSTPALFVVAALWSPTRLVQEVRLERYRLVQVNIYEDGHSPWVEICRWIGAHAPSDTVYITPPGNEGFTYLSNRSNVVEFKTDPDGAEYLAEWLVRLSDLAGGSLPNGHGFENLKLLNEAFAALPPASLVAIGERYHAKYAVLPASSAVDFEVLHRNEQYRLVRLPSKESELQPTGREVLR